MKTVWSKEISNLGYKNPKPDPQLGGHHGGNPNSKLDIFIQDVGRFGLYGFCTTDDPKSNVRRDVSAYCVFDDDYAGSSSRGIHGVSRAQGDGRPRVPPRLPVRLRLEGRPRASWRQPRPTWKPMCTRSIHDNFQYFAASPLVIKTNTACAPVDLFDSDFGNQYGDWIFFRFLAEYFGGATHPIDGAPTLRSTARSGTRQRPCRERTTAGSTRLRRSRQPSPLDRPDHEHPGGLLPRVRQLRLGQREARRLVQGRRPVSVRWVRQPWVPRLDGDSDRAELADVPLRTTTCSSNRTRPRRPSTSRSTSRPRRRARTAHPV